MLPSFHLRPHERRPVLVAFFTLLGIMAGHAVLETARDALFLAELPASRLPWVYLGIAVAALAITALQQRSPGRRAGLSLWLVGSATVTLAFWGLTNTGAVWSLYALYAWTGIFGTLVVVRFWILLQDLFTITQAKRIFAVIGAGSVLGAIVGSALARLLAGLMGTTLLLPTAALLLLVAALGPWRLRLEPEAEPATDAAPAENRLGDALRLVRAQPYLRRVASLLLVSTVTLTLVDWLFKSRVAAAVPDEQLGEYFASVYLVLNLLSLVIQISLAGWLLRAHGVIRALALLPILLVAGGAGVALGGGLVAALALKGADGGLRHSLHRTALEVLYVPLSGNLRGRVKVFLDVLGQRGGQALASVGILVAVALGVPPAWLGVAVMALAALWIYLADNLQGHYLELFRANLRGSLARARGTAPLDLAALESLIAALSSQDEGEVVAALDLLAKRRKTRLIPLLILYHPSSRVVLRALETFTEAERQDLVPMARGLLAHPDPEVRAAALRALNALAPEARALRDALEDPSPVVHATALIGLVASGSAVARQALHSVEAIAAGGSIDSKRAIARAIQHQESAIFEPTLRLLVREPAPEVRREVLHAMKHLPSPGFLPVLLPLLESRDLRPAARTALLGIGAEGLAFLERALIDPRTPLAIRRHLPRTISRFDARPATRILLTRLTEERDGVVRYKILRALGRLRADNPGLVLDPRVLDAVVRDTLATAFRLINWRLDLERGARLVPDRATTVQGLLVTLLRHKEEHAIERLFRLLGLVHPPDDLHRIHRSLKSPDPKARASGLELLQHLLAPPLRQAVIGLVDEVDDNQRLLAAQPYHAPRSSGYAVVLEEVLRYGGTALPTLAAYHAGELGLEELRADIEALEPEAPPLLRTALARAQELMTLGPREGLAYGG